MYSTLKHSCYTDSTLSLSLLRASFSLSFLPLPLTCARAGDKLRKMTGLRWPRGRRGGGSGWESTSSIKELGVFSCLTRWATNAGRSRSISTRLGNSVRMSTSCATTLYMYHPVTESSPFLFNLFFFKYQFFVFHLHWREFRLRLWLRWCEARQDSWWHQHKFNILMTSPPETFLAPNHLANEMNFPAWQRHLKPTHQTHMASTCCGTLTNL